MKSYKTFDGIRGVFLLLILAISLIVLISVFSSLSGSKEQLISKPLKKDAELTVAKIDLLSCKTQTREDTLRCDSDNRILMQEIKKNSTIHDLKMKVAAAKFQIQIAELSRTIAVQNVKLIERTKSQLGCIGSKDNDL